MTRALLHPRGVLIVTGAFFVALALTVALVGNFAADAATRDALLGVAAPPFISVMRVANEMGTWHVILPGMVLVLLLIRRAREQWWVWLTLVAVAPLAEGVLKYLVGRPRPEGPSMGFPSGHATAAAAFFGAVMYLAGGLPPGPRRWVRGLAPVAIVLVGLARVALRAHWPSDVAGGIALGLALAAAAALLASRPSAAQAESGATAEARRASAAVPDGRP